MNKHSSHDSVPTRSATLAVRTVGVIATLAALVAGCGNQRHAPHRPCSTAAFIASATSPFPASRLPRPFPATLGTLAVSYTSESGVHYAGDVVLPAYKAAFAVLHNPCSATIAQLGTVVRAEAREATPPGIDTHLGPIHGSGTSSPLLMNVQLTFKVDRGSPLLQAGSCATIGSAGETPSEAETAGDSLSGYALGLQAGLPFAHDLDCSTSGAGGGAPPGEVSSGRSENLPVRQVVTLVKQLASEQPTYVLTFEPTALGQGSPCIAFLAPGGKVRLLSQAAIPSGAADTAVSDCTNSHISFTAAP